ncbi:unnamed protein product [Brassica rapa subsp. narinosa]
MVQSNKVAVYRFAKTTNMVWMIAIYETRRLFHIDFFIQSSLQEGIVDV